MKMWTGKQIITDIMMLCIGAAFICFLYPFDIPLTALLILSSVFLLKFWFGRRELYHFITAIVIGTLAEIAATYSGAWIYAYATLMIIPLWVPIGWGLFVMIISHIADSLVSQEYRKNR